MRKKHPEEARKCLEGSKHSNLYKSQAGSEQNSDGNPDDGQPDTGSKEQWEAAVKVMVKTGSKPEAKSQAEAARNFILFCALDLQPCTLSSEPGHLAYQSSSDHCLGLISQNQFDNTLANERRTVAHHISKALQAQQGFISFGPCCALQLDSWSHPTCRFVYAVATVTFVTPSFDLKRLGLDVQCFPKNGFTSKAVRFWLERITQEYFHSRTPSNVYIACTAGEGEPFAAAASALQIPVLRCAVSRIGKVVLSGFTPSGPPSAKMGVGELMRRANEVASYLIQPSRRNPELAALQEAMSDNLQPLRSPGDGPYAFLETCMALLRTRTLIGKHFSNEASPSLDCHRPDPLTDAEWSKLCEAVGVIEACAEVDRNIRLSGGVASLTTTLMQLRDLREYMTDDTLYLPEPQHDLDAHRVEKQADQLDSVLWHMRSTISAALCEQEMGTPLNKQERLAAMLDIFTKDSLLAEEQCTQAWNELASEFSKARAFMAPQSGDSDAPGPSGSEVAQPDINSKNSESASGKRKWQGALSMRKEQRRKMYETVPSSPYSHDAELESYKATLRLAAAIEHNKDILDWWLERSSEVSEASAGTCSGHDMRVTQLPVLAHLASQYHGIDASSIQAECLFSGVGYRMHGLEKLAAANSIENMLFLRLNKDLVSKEL